MGGGWWVEDFWKGAPGSWELGRLGLWVVEQESWRERGGAGELEGKGRCTRDGGK